MGDVRKVAFLGTGIMGSAIAGHLLDAGYELSVYNRTKEKANALVTRGAMWADSVAEVAEDDRPRAAFGKLARKRGAVFVGQMPVIGQDAALEEDGIAPVAQHVLVVSANLLRLVPDGGDGEMWCKDREGVDADGVAWSPLVHGRIPKEGLLFVLEAFGAEETLAVGECLVGDVSHDRMYAPGVEEEEGRKIAYREFFAFDQAKQIILKSSTTAECELVVVHAFYLLGE